MTDAQRYLDLISPQRLYDPHHYDGDLMRYEFPDGSAILNMGARWVYGYSAEVVKEHDVLRYVRPDDHTSAAAALDELYTTEDQ
ncbi:hypothetical protein LCGC14_1406470 [marine sediment metagenome]|uniref:Uncharacterized protein n=1 Tax=marine sediment metagenome TaxID=412755 RepID=A0A0F9MX54_9ZZZZ